MALLQIAREEGREERKSREMQRQNRQHNRHFERQEGKLVCFSSSEYNGPPPPSSLPSPITISRPVICQTDSRKRQNPPNPSLEGEKSTFVTAAASVVSCMRRSSWEVQRKGDRGEEKKRRTKRLTVKMGERGKREAGAMGKAGIVHLSSPSLFLSLWAARNALFRGSEKKRKKRERKTASKALRRDCLLSFPPLFASHT